MASTAILSTAIGLFAGCSNDRAPIRVTANHMGTEVTISVASNHRRVAESAISRAFAEIELVDSQLSSYDEDSELSRLNRNGYLEHPSEMLVENLRESLSYARLTNGAFDITVLPILDLYETRITDDAVLPSEDEVSRALERVDYRKIRLLEDRIEIGPGQRITLGGIAKGYAVDRAVAALVEAGVGNAIVEAGGDLRVIGKKTATDDWHIAVENPRNPGEYIARLRVPDRAVVTSGDYRRYYDADREYHHIIDPTTGRSATSLISVTVVADQAFAADAMSTAAFVLGPERGLELIESLDDVEALFITRSRQVIRSHGFSRYEVRK